MIEITQEEAKKILQMQDVCFAEGIGPTDTTPLVRKIIKAWPEMVSDHQWWIALLDIEEHGTQQL